MAKNCPCRSHYYPKIDPVRTLAFFHACIPSLSQYRRLRLYILLYIYMYMKREIFSDQSFFQTPYSYFLTTHPSILPSFLPSFYTNMSNMSTNPVNLIVSPLCLQREFSSSSLSSLSLLYSLKWFHLWSHLVITRFTSILNLRGRRTSYLIERLHRYVSTWIMSYITSAHALDEESTSSNTPHSCHTRTRPSLPFSLNLFFFTIMSYAKKLSLFLIDDWRQFPVKLILQNFEKIFPPG